MNKKQILLIVILFMLFIPFFQSGFNITKEWKLKGDVVIAPDTVFTKKKWWSGDYQKLKELYLNDNFGFRNFFIRINNQISFSLFNKAKANSIIIGKNNYIYEFFIIG